MSDIMATKACPRGTKKVRGRCVSKHKDELYLLFVWGDIEPELKGPFSSVTKRNKAARQFRKKEGREHGIFMLGIEPSGKPWVGGYSGAFFGDEES